MLTSLINFVENQEKIMIYYLDDHGDLTQRIIKVIRLNEENLLGFCYYRKSIRSFKLVNILSWGKIGSKASA
jgi:predicted DNA-binding transcriptional regulator YafY